MSRYIHQLKKWPLFEWDQKELLSAVSSVRHNQGRLLGRLDSLGFQLREEATLETLTEEVIKSSEIEGEKLSHEQVRSSIAKRLGIEMITEVATNRNIEGVVEMMLDANQNYNQSLTEERLFGWHSSLFPTGRIGLHKIQVGKWRKDSRGPMQVVSGSIGREKIHFEAPKASNVPLEMKTFLKWFNDVSTIDPVLKAAIAHLWFVTIHPFDDGNGRIARAIADLQLARADRNRQRFYSMSAQIQRDRHKYYEVLESTQKGELDITDWLLWFLECLDRAIGVSEQNLSSVIRKSKFWEAHPIGLNTRQRKVLNRLLDGFEGNLTSSKWAKIAKCSTDTALRDIQDLIEKEILEKEERGGRSTSYRMIKVI